MGLSGKHKVLIKARDYDIWSKDENGKSTFELVLEKRKTSRKQKRLNEIKRPIKIRRITIDLDEDKIHHLAEVIKKLKQEGFEEIEIKTSSGGIGKHIIGWHPIGFYKTDLLRLRQKCFDDKIRIYLDSFSSRAINVLFSKKNKKEKDLKEIFDFDKKKAIGFETIGEETNVKISYGETI